MPYRIGHASAWTFASEVAFLDKLGLGHFVLWETQAKQPTRAALLRGYLSGLDQRERGFTERETSALRAIAQNLLKTLK